MVAELPNTRDIFLSHRSVDKDFVRQLQRAIELQEFGGRQLLAWVDEAEIRPGQSITGLVNQGLEISRFIGLVMTPAYFESGSGWTDAEWHAALFDDPDNRGGRVIPMLASDCPKIPPLLRHLMFLDFRGNRFNSSFDRLLSILRNQPLPRPVPFRGQLVQPSGILTKESLIAERAIPDAYPDVSNEHVYGNLLPIRRPPDFIWVAKIGQQHRGLSKSGKESLPTKPQAREIIRTAMEKDGLKPWTPAFRIVGEEVFSFHDMEDPECPMIHLIDGDTIDAVSLDDMVDDYDDRRIVVSLLNMAIERHLFGRGLVLDSERIGRVFFPPSGEQEDQPRQFRWRPAGKRDYPRTVTKPFVTDGQQFGWLHAGAYIRVIYLASKFFIRIKPTWLLTEDGRKPKSGPGVGRIVIRWTGQERNIHILYHVRFWTAVLKRNAGQHLLIQAGDQPMEVAGVPAFVELAFGVVEDRIRLMESLDREAEILAQEEEAQLDVNIAMTDEDDDLEDDMDDIVDEEGEYDGEVTSD